MKVVRGMQKGRSGSGLRETSCYICSMCTMRGVLTIPLPVYGGRCTMLGKGS
jgi:hypothetical protein